MDINVIRSMVLDFRKDTKSSPILVDWLIENGIDRMDAQWFVDRVVISKHGLIWQYAVECLRGSEKMFDKTLMLAGAYASQSQGISRMFGWKDTILLDVPPSKRKVVWDYVMRSISEL